MTDPFAQITQRIQAARAELNDTLARAERGLSRFRQQTQPTPDERQQFHDAARRGELGDDMRELADRIDRGEDSWEAVFSAESPNAHLLRGHLERTIADNQAAVRRALDEDDTFDLEQLRRDAED